MPELPEVEVVRRHLSPLIGKVIRKVAVRIPEVVIGDPEGFIKTVSGRKITGLSRRGKVLMIELSGEEAVVCHFKMSGNYRLSASGTPLDYREAVVLILDDGRRLSYTTIRKLGWVRLMKLTQDGAVWKTLGLGPDFFEVDQDRFSTLITTRHRQIKPLLLDQAVVAGIGNIVADEALFRAKIHPRETSDRLTSQQTASLHQALTEVIEAAMISGGSTIGNFRLPDGRNGKFQDQHLIYGRKGLACVRCRTPVERTIIGSRSTFFCPRCQPGTSPCRTRRDK